MVNTELLSYFCCAISVIFYGSNYVVVKKFPTGDGMFFQFTLTLGIFITALFLEFVTNPTHEFYPFAMLGGVIWTTGNLLTVPVIQTIGISLGLSIWGISNLAMGWLTGTFGLFGIDPQSVNNQTLNVIGALLACISVPFYGFIKSMEPVKKNTDTKSLLHKQNNSSTSSDDEHEYEKKKENDDENQKDEEQGNQNIEFRFSQVLERLPPIVKRSIGVVLALIIGLFFGSNFTPPQYLIDHNYGPETQYSYLFSHACGIFITGTIYFIAYSIIKMNKPIFYPQTFLPGIVSGIIWEIAQICFMYSNTYLPWSITFSINASGPGLISTLWGIFVFGEIRGWKNYTLFLIGVLFLFSGIICVVFSR